MSQDFVFINPNQIPPRRSSPKKNKHHHRPHRAPPEIITNPPQVEDSLPGFSLTQGFKGQTILSGYSAPDSSPEFADAGLNNIDPITEAIFSSGSAGVPIPQKSYLVANSNTSPKSKSETTPSVLGEPDTRESLLAELERINEDDNRLHKKITRLVSPGRAEHIKIRTIPVSSGTVPEKPKRIGHYGLEFDESDFKDRASESRNDFREDTARAEDDWFSVGFANNRYSISNPRPQVLRKNYQAEPSLPDSKPKSTRTFLAGLAIVLVPVALGGLIVLGQGGFLSAATASFSSKFLSTSSFILVNAVPETTFPGLLEIKNSLASLPEATTALDDFLQKNTGFSWLDIFKKKEVSAKVSINNLELLTAASQKIPEAPEFKKIKESLGAQISFLNFWNRVLTPDKHYLLVLDDPALPRPLGGQPESYALVETDGQNIRNVGSGKFNTLDAATDVKIIPPQPLQALSTAWLPSEAGWFLNFQDSARTLADFFERTTQNKLDGVIALDKDFLKSVGFKESLIFDADSASWFYDLETALSRKPNERWPGLAQAFLDGLTSHRIQFYFKDAWLEKYIAANNWSLSPQADNKNNDSLGLALAGFKGSGAAVEAIADTASVFEDGSITAKLDISLRQDDIASSESYLKIYLPKGAQILKVDGFSAKEKVPEFNYAANGFSTDPRLEPVVANKDLAEADLFEESGLAVVGGWVQLSASARKTISLQYILPFRMERQKAFSSYNLKIARPPQKDDVPFRFTLTPQKGISIVSLDPDGFVTANSGQYQANLSQDLNLNAGLVFTK